MVTRGTSLPDEIAAGLGQAGIQAEMFHVEHLARFAELLLEEALPRGFIGPKEADRLVPRHIVESAALAAHLPEGRLADVGSGAGLPGLVLACLGWPVDLIETTEKRAAFLQEAIDHLGIEGTVHQTRAEEAGHSDLREAADGVTARALAVPPVALELCLPLVRVGGRLLIPTSRDAAAGVDLVRVSKELGGNTPVWEDLSVPGADPPRCVMIVDKVRSTPERYPRRSGVPKRRPLG